MALETSGRSAPSPTATPPFLDFTGYRLSGVGPMASRDEPRQSPRRPLYCKMLLIDNGADVGPMLELLRELTQILK